MNTANELQKAQMKMTLAGLYIIIEVTAMGGYKLKVKTRAFMKT